MCPTGAEAALALASHRLMGTKPSQRLQPFHQVLVVAPSDACGRCRRSCRRHAYREGSHLGPHRYLGVSVRGIEADVAEPCTDYIGLDAGATFARMRSTVDGLMK